MGVFKREKPSVPRSSAAAAAVDAAAAVPPRKAAGDAAEARAQQWLLARGLEPVARNYRVARGPSARGGEVDLIVREPDGTLVFVEVRARADARFGGAAASVGTMKQRRIVYAAQHYLMRLASPPPCRFDVIAFDGDEVQWIRGAFEAG